MKGRPMPKVRIDAYIEKALRNDLLEIATEDRFEGNFSQVVRLALKEFRDRRRRHASKSPGPSS
jgi:hypothetical protein